MKICHEQAFNDIGVVIATKRCHCLFYFIKQYFSALGTVPKKSFTGTFFSDSCLDFSEVKTESIRALLGYFGMKFLSL